MSSSRLHLLAQTLSAEQAYLLTDAHDIYYYTGFVSLVPEEREAFLVVTQREQYLIYTSFSPLPADLTIKTLPGTYPTQLLSHLKKIAAEHNLHTLKIDKSKMYADEYEVLSELETMTLESFNKNAVWDQRMVKDESELAAIKKASHITHQAFSLLQEQLKVGMTELEIQWLLEDIMRSLGSRTFAFPTIVAFNDHIALPHHQPSDTPLRENTAILIDFGASSDWYRSDMTRTWWFGTEPSAEFTQLKQIVDAAYAEVFTVFTTKRAAGEIVTAADLDNAARDLITDNGFGNEYIHTTGHGVGLDIHEQPSLNFRSQQVIEDNMVITIEPGIYLPGKLGYRYENTVVVTPSQLEEVTLS